MMDWRYLLDVGCSKLLSCFLSEESLVDRVQYSKSLDLADKAGIFLGQQCTDDRQKLRGVAYLLKSMVSNMLQIGGYNTPCDCRAELRFNFFTPFIEADKAAALSACCTANNITALDLLDIGLSWFGVEEANSCDSTELGAVGRMWREE